MDHASTPQPHSSQRPKDDKCTRSQVSSQVMLKCSPQVAHSFAHIKRAIATIVWCILPSSFNELPKYPRVPGMYSAKQRGANYEENEEKVRRLPLLQLSLSKFFLYWMCSKWSTSKNLNYPSQKRKKSSISSIAFCAACSRSVQIQPNTHQTVFTNWL